MRRTVEVLIPAGKFGTSESYKLLLERHPEAQLMRSSRTPGVFKFRGGRAVTTCRRLVLTYYKAEVQS